MKRNEAERRRREAGWTLVEMMVAMVIITIATAIAIPTFINATDDAKLNSTIVDARALYDAFTAYYLDEGHFPPEWGPSGFNRKTLDPLATEGYFPIAKPFLQKMAGSQLMLYLAPDIGTRDAEYIAVYRAAYDPNVIVVVAQTGIIHAAGHFLDGVYVIDDGQLKKTMKSTEAEGGTACLEPEEGAPTETLESSAFAIALTRSRESVDRVLDDLPDIRQEARRVITRELGFSPTPEQLQMIDSMVHGRAAKDSLRESLRSILALRLVATHAVDELLDAPELDGEEIRHNGRLMPSLVTAVRYMEEGVRSGVQELAPEDRECLLQTAQALIPSRDRLTAGAVLAPRLELLARAGKQGELSAAVPLLTDDDVALVRTAVASSEDWTDGASRVCINALTLRTIIEDDLASWEMFRGVTKGDPFAPGTREWSQARLERDRIAYDVLAEQLQTRQDTALVAGLREFADELSRVKGELFASYLKLAPALRDAARSVIEETRDGAAPAPLDMESLLEECAQADRLAEQQQRTSTDEVYLNALREMDGSPTTPTAAPTRKQQTPVDSRRLRAMVGIAALLFAVAAVQWGFLLRGERKEEVRLDVTDIPGKLLLSDAMAVGPMMYAQISHFTWDSLTEPQRVRRVEDLALIATDRGFEKVWLTDEQYRHLATWSKPEGVELIELEPPKPTPGRRG